MDSFLKYLRGGGGGAVAGTQRAAAVATTTIAASACEDGGGVEDDASFFDLEFAVPGDETDAEEERVEFNFDVASAAGGAEVVAGEEKKDGGAEGAEVAAPPPPVPPRPASATKFRVLLLKLRKPNKAALEGAAPVPAAAKSTATSRFLVKFLIKDEAAPPVSLFTRDNSSRTSSEPPVPAQVQQAEEEEEEAEEERRFAKEVVLKYLNKIKPLYVKVSRLRFAKDDGDDTNAEAEAEAPSQPQPVVVACGVRAPRASVPAGLKQVCKRLGKSRSASSAVAAAPPPVASPNPATTVAAHQRRDDSLLQVQDGIQSAIAHCKRSFNASKGCESPLLRSMTVAGDATRAADNSDGGA